MSVASSKLSSTCWYCFVCCSSVAKRVFSTWIAESNLLRMGKDQIYSSLSSSHGHCADYQTRQCVHLGNSLISRAPRRICINFANSGTAKALWLIHKMSGTAPHLSKEIWQRSKAFYSFSRRNNGAPRLRGFAVRCHVECSWGVPASLAPRRAADARPETR